MLLPPPGAPRGHLPGSRVPGVSGVGLCSPGGMGLMAFLRFGRFVLIRHLQPPVPQTLSFFLKLNDNRFFIANQSLAGSQNESL